MASCAIPVAAMAAGLPEGCPDVPMLLLWTLTFPYAARMPARRGGEWLLSVEPARGGARWLWSVQHSLDAGPSRQGETGSPAFSKGQAEHAAAELDARDHPGPADTRSTEPGDDC